MPAKKHKKNGGIFSWKSATDYKFRFFAPSFSSEMETKTGSVMVTNAFIYFS